MRDLSIIIPARNEMFLAKTIENILENKRANTEVIAILDGQWSDPPIPQNKDVKVVYFPESIGQRKSIKKGVSIARGKYIMKVDAHCAFDEGFDRKMLDDMQDDWTFIPLMKNLHAFDWGCKNGHRKYQSPTPDKCEHCGESVERKIVWRAKPSPNSTSYRFDKTMHFQYWKEFSKRPEGKGDITPTLSIQGSCYMMTKEKYIELDIDSDEFHSWGQQGVEVAMKTWMSGGKVMVNHKTWYAHMFRTQGGDFGFPYPQSGSEINENRELSRELFQRNGWTGAKLTFEEVLNKFYPVPEWHDKNGNKEIIYYTDNQLKVEIAKKVQRNIEGIGLPIISASLKPMPHFGDNLYLPLKRGYITMFTQILFALKKAKANYVFFTEHDVIYHPSHFEFTPLRDDIFYFNENVWHLDTNTNKAFWYDKCGQNSQLCANRELLIDWVENKLKDIEKNGFDGHFEPQGKREYFKSKVANIDIRHTSNLTKTKRSLDDFNRKPNEFIESEEIPEWGHVNTII